MKRVWLMLLLIWLGTKDITAQNGLSVDYEKAEDRTIFILNFEGMEYRDIRVCGDVMGKRYLISENIMENGILTVREHLSYVPCVEDTLKLNVITKIEGDSLRFRISWYITNLFETQYPYIPDYHRILMETYPAEAENSVAIPVIAYTSGISREYERNGEIFTSYDYCGLRDAKVHPAFWHERFGINDYVWFEVKFLE